MTSKNTHIHQNRTTTLSKTETLIKTLHKKMVVSPRQILRFLLSHFWLILLGIAIEGFYLFYLLRAFPLWSNYQSLTDMGIMNNYSHTGFLMFLLIFSFLFVLLILAQKCSCFYQGKAALYLILGLGLLFSCTLIFVYPINAIDIFGYIAESRVLVLYHADPLIVAPIHYTQDTFIQSLSNFVATPAPYGPLGILIASVTTLFSGFHLLTNLLLLKGMCTLFLSGSSYLIYKIIQHYKPEMALSCALLLAWNPYAQLEYVVNSHNDIMMIFFLLLAILACVKNHHIAAFALILLSLLIKYAALPLLPLFFIHAIFSYKIGKDRVRYFLSICGATLIILGILVLPFWRGTQTFTSFSTTAQGSLYSFSMFLNDFSMLKVSFDQSKIIGFGIFGGFYLCALWLASRNQMGLLIGCFLTLFTFLTFAVTYVQPWYIIWACIPALLIPDKQGQRVSLILAYGAILIELIHPYIWPWGAYQNASAYAIINSIAYLLLFCPTLFLLVKYAVDKIIIHKPHLN